MHCGLRSSYNKHDGCCGATHQNQPTSRRTSDGSGILRFSIRMHHQAAALPLAFYDLLPSADSCSPFVPPPSDSSVLVSVDCNAEKEKKNKGRRRRTRIESRPSVRFEMEPKAAAIVADVPHPLILTSGASGRVNALLSLRALKALVMLLYGFLLFVFLPFRRQQKRCFSSVGGEKEKAKEEKQEAGARKGSAGVWVQAAMVSRRSSGSGSGSGAGAAADLEVAVRRAMAIKRVGQDRDERTVREFALFPTARGETMFTQSWTPATGEVRYGGISVLIRRMSFSPFVLCPVLFLVEDFSFFPKIFMLREISGIDAGDDRNGRAKQAQSRAAVLLGVDELELMEG
ncbi:hypothetical protein ACLOJK_025571 [Asimina triloba]